MIEAICEDLKHRCTGCEACKFACPCSCIEMVFDEEGFAFPSIDDSACVSCETCIRVCPNNRAPECESLAGAWSFQENGDSAMRSSSGGAFHALGLNMIEQGGAVYGFAFDGVFVVMRRSDNEADLDWLRGSKYVQGSIGGSYRQIEQDITRGIPVAVCGTACQIAGLRSYLGDLSKEVLLIDLVCHGVPSPKMFERHVSYLEHRYEDDLVEFVFRDKRRTHWLMSKHFLYRFARGGDVDGGWRLDPYYNAYLKGLTMRECCYRCPYSTAERCSDLTLCDFWGAEKVPRTVDRRIGVSALIAHTEKGRKSTAQLAAYGVLNEIEVHEVVNGNPNLERPTNRPEARDCVYADISRMGYDSWAKRQVSLKDRVLSKIFDLIPLCAVEPLQKLRGCGRSRRKSD